jgi:hypothetical protein
MLGTVTQLCNPTYLISQRSGEWQLKGSTGEKLERPNLNKKLGMELKVLFKW